MPKTILTTGGIPTATTANTLQYWPLAVTSIESPNTVESNRQIVYRTPGTISKLYVRVTANTINATSVINVRKNGLDAGLSVSIGANATGFFENTTNTVTVAAGDKLDYQSAPGAATGTMSISIFSVLFEPINNTETVSRLATSVLAVYATASVSRYNQIAGNQLSSNANEILAHIEPGQPGTTRNLAINISSNARTTNTTFKTRKNTADGNVTVTIPPAPAGAGFTEDTTHSDTLASTDKSDIATLTGTGTENLACQGIAIDFVSTGGYGLTVNARGAGFTVNTSSTNYFPIAGAINTGTAEADAKLKPRMKCRLSGLKIHVQGNSITAASTLRLRKNGANANMLVTVGASTNGFITDTTNTDTFETGDEISLQFVTGATGTTLVMRSISLNVIDLTAEKTISDTISVSEPVKDRTKAAWRLQP